MPKTYHRVDAADEELPVRVVPVATDARRCEEVVDNERLRQEHIERVEHRRESVSGGLKYALKYPIRVSLKRRKEPGRKAR